MRINIPLRTHISCSPTNSPGCNELQLQLETIHLFTLPFPFRPFEVQFPDITEHESPSQLPAPSLYTVTVPREPFGSFPVPHLSLQSRCHVADQLRCKPGTRYCDIPLPPLISMFLNHYHGFFKHTNHSSPRAQHIIIDGIFLNPTSRQAQHSKLRSSLGNEPFSPPPRRLTNARCPREAINEFCSP